MLIRFACWVRGAIWRAFLIGFFIESSLLFGPFLISVFFGVIFPSADSMQLLFVMLMATQFPTTILFIAFPSVLDSHVGSMALLCIQIVILGAVIRLVSVILCRRQA